MDWGPKIHHLTYSGNNKNFPEKSKRVILKQFFNACRQAQFHKNLKMKSRQ